MQSSLPARPRILHLIDTGGPGGAETVFLTLLDRLSPDRWENHVVLPDRGWLYSQLTDRGITPILLPSVHAFDARYLSGIVRIIRRLGVDLLQTHLFGTAVYGSMAGRICGIPVISTIHGLVDIGQPGFRRALKVRVLNRSKNRVILVSERLKQALSQQTRLRADITRVILNGIDTNAFRRERDASLRDELGVPANGILIGAVGNVRWPKDYGTLLEAAARLVSLSPDYHIAIIGDTDGERQLYDELLAKRASLGLEGAVHFCGFRRDAVRVLNNLDVYVMSSIREGLPLALLQAMATGIPAVSTRCGGPQELIIDKVNGRLTDVSDPAALAQAIHEIAQDRERAMQFAQAARRTIDERFTVERMIEQYEAVYAESLGAYNGVHSIAAMQDVKA